MKKVDFEAEDIEFRSELCRKRLSEIPSEKRVPEEYLSFFGTEAKKLSLIFEYEEKIRTGAFSSLNEKECETLQSLLYSEILPENYESGYSNPVYCVKEFGKRFGKLLTYLAARWNTLIFYAAEGKRTALVLQAELFLQLYGEFVDFSEFTFRSCREAIVSFDTDNLEYFTSLRVVSLFDPSDTFVKDIINSAAGDRLTYLYRYGEYITENEKKIARFLFEQKEEVIEKAARNVVDGFLRGFQVMRVELREGQTVGLRYAIGFERILQRVITLLADHGLSVTSARTPVDKRFARKTGYTVSNLNMQYDYDHRNDEGLVSDKQWYARKEEVLASVYEEYRADVEKYAGPLVQETFGENQPLPQNRVEAIVLDKRQQKQKVMSIGKERELLEQYLPSEKTSFTIVSYPLPSIGGSFEQIFMETLKINCLDNEQYKKTQQCLIDALDQAELVHIKGKGQNRTDLTVCLMKLRNKEKETLFENCTADVNIPAGEVFTSPKLQGTCGLLHVPSVFLGNSEYKNLQIVFKDGKTESYSCENYEKPEENVRFLRETLLKNHDWLPMSEFAIGTNTRAFVMGKKFGITGVLPILIAEKTGPHFAVGDTCYSYVEDHKVYNPDGKEIIARDNEISLLRKSATEEAYFQCHTDITLPYDELEEIAAIKADGKRIVLIRDGRFVLPGTEELNEAFQDS